MAETFKNASKVSVSSSNAETVYTTPPATTGIILGVAIANKSSNTVAVTLYFNDFTALSTVQMLPAVQIPGNTTLEVLAGQKYVLETSDFISAQTDTANAIDITMGILELS